MLLIFGIFINTILVKWFIFAAKAAESTDKDEESPDGQNSSVQLEEMDDESEAIGEEMSNGVTKIAVSWKWWMPHCP